MLERLKWILLAVGAFILLVTGIWIGWVLPARLADPTANGRVLQTPGIAVTVTGMPVCLPHKNSGAQTLECAIGVKTDDGFYYSLKNPSSGYLQISGIQFGKTAVITGVLLYEKSTIYQTDGAITVNGYSQ
jgi:hypothetical protein